MAWKQRSVDGVPLNFPDTMSDEEINKITKSKEAKDYVSGLPKIEARPEGEQTASKIPPVQPTGQFPGGPMREIGIGVEQAAIGGLQPIAIPGDLNRFANELSSGIIPQSPYLPTSEGLERAIQSPQLTPTGEGERLYAAGVRGAAAAASPIGAIRAPGYAISPLVGSNPLSRFGRPIVSPITGAGAGVAAQATEDYYPPLDENQRVSLAPLAPPSAGALTGMVLGGGANLAQRAVMGAPYPRVVNSLGGDLNQGTPYLRDVGTGIKADLRAATPLGSTLDPATYARLTNARTSGDTVATTALTDPAAATALRNDMPDRMDELAGSNLANRGPWNTLHPRVQQSLIPDARQRATVDEFHAALPRGTAMEINLTQALHRFIASEGIVGLTGLAMHFAGMDPSIHSGMVLLGSTVPWLDRAGRMLAESSTARQSLLGGYVGIPQGTSLIPPMDTQPQQ